MFKEFRKEIPWGGRQLILESGRIARQADGAVLATLGETKVLCTVVYEKTPKASSRLLPALGALPGEKLRGGQDPGRILQARGASVGEGNPHLPPDRSAHSAAVCEGIPQRDAGHLHGAEPRSGERSGYRGPDRLFGRADPFGRSLPRSGRRLQGRLHQWPIRAESATRRDRIERSRPGRRRHAGWRADGRIRGQGAFRGGDARSGDVRSPEFPAGDRRDHRLGRSLRQGAA